MICKHFFLLFFTFTLGVYMNMNEVKGRTTQDGVQGPETIGNGETSVDGNTGVRGEGGAVIGSDTEINRDALRYEITKKSDGKIAKAGQRVHVHYTGWLNQDGGKKGTKFDSSVDRGSPFVFVLGQGQVIKGWDEGVAGMQVGEKRTLFIPSALGYGTSGAGQVIPPNADLIFDVELIDIKD